MTREVSLIEALSQAMDASTGRLEGIVVVQVQSFNRSAQTVEVIPQVMRDGEQQPNVVEVPVLFPVAYVDLQPGTYGVLLVGGLNWRRWWRTGEISEPEDDERHGLTNGIFLPGLHLRSEVSGLAANSTALVPPTGTGKVKLGTFTADQYVVHEGLLTDLSDMCSKFQTWATAVDALVGPTGLVAALNAALLLIQVQAPLLGYQSKIVQVDK